MRLDSTLWATGCCLALVCSPQLGRAEENPLDILLAAKAGGYQTSGNLFSEEAISGWGLSIKMIPQSFYEVPGNAVESFFGGTGMMLSLDLDNLNGHAQKEARFPFKPDDEIELAWSTLIAYGCALTQSRVQICLGLPLSNALYVEQTVGGQTWNSFSMGNSNPPVFLTFLSRMESLHFGLQFSTSYWNPVFAGVSTHFNLLQSQVYLGYAF